MGISADGVFGDYHYRHPEYKAYIAETHTDIPMLEGGIRETALGRRLSPAIAALLTGSVSSYMLQELQAEPLLDRWQESLLIKKDLDSAHFTLTANGSWFMADMISELKAWVRR